MDDTCTRHHADLDTTCATCTTAFDAAVAELIRCWTAREDLRQRGEASLEAVTAAWLALDRARAWVSTFEGAGRQVGLGRMRSGRSTRVRP